MDTAPSTGYIINKSVCSNKNTIHCNSGFWHLELSSFAFFFMRGSNFRLSGDTIHIPDPHVGVVTIDVCWDKYRDVYDGT